MTTLTTYAFWAYSQRQIRSPSSALLDPRPSAEFPAKCVNSLDEIAEGLRGAAEGLRPPSSVNARYTCSSANYVCSCDHINCTSEFYFDILITIICPNVNQKK